MTQQERSKNAFLKEIRRTEGLNQKQSLKAYRAFETRTGKAPTKADLGKRSGIRRDVVNYVSGQGAVKANAAAKQAYAETKRALAAQKLSQAGTARSDAKKAASIARQAIRNAKEAVKQAKAATKEAGKATQAAKRAIAATDRYLKKQARQSAETKRKPSPASRKGGDARKQREALQRPETIRPNRHVSLRSLAQWNEMIYEDFGQYEEFHVSDEYEYTE